MAFMVCVRVLGAHTEIVLGYLAWVIVGSTEEVMAPRVMWGLRVARLGSTTRW
jgi:hypothetical protein